MAAQLTLPYEQTPSSPQASTSGITEIIVSEFGNDQSAILLPMLAHLSNKCTDRWLTWIAPKGITKELLSEYGFNLQRLRVIHLSKQSRNGYWMLSDALANGCSHTVVCTADTLSEDEIQELEIAARKGESRGLLLRNRQH